MPTKKTESPVVKNSDGTDAVAPEVVETEVEFLSEEVVETEEEILQEPPTPSPYPQWPASGGG